MTPIRFVSMVAAGLLALAAGSAAAQQTPAVAKIGYVYVERVLAESRASRRVQESLEAEFKKRVAAIDAGPARDAERRRLALQDELGQRRSDALREFMARVNVVVRRLAEAEKYDAVFFEATYVDVRIDLTEKVIKALDAAK